MFLPRIVRSFVKTASLAALAPLAVAACSTTSTGTGSGGGGDGGTTTGNCSNYGGSWSLTGSCQETDCTATQSGCTLSVQCGGGTSLSGAVTGTRFTLRGAFTDGAQGSCSGIGTGRTIQLTCTSGCAATATCSFGACGGSSGGATGGGF